MADIYHDIEILSHQKAIYNAITGPDGLNQWWTLKSTGVPKLGATYNFYFDEDYN